MNKRKLGIILLFLGLVFTAPMEGYLWVLGLAVVLAGFLLVLFGSKSR